MYADLEKIFDFSERHGTPMDGTKTDVIPEHRFFALTAILDAFQIMSVKFVLSSRCCVKAMK